MPDSVALWVHRPGVGADGTVKSPKLNYRTGPGLNYSVLGSLPRGGKVRRIRDRGDWVQIAPPAGAVAYVATRLLAPPGSVAATPALAPAPALPPVRPMPSAQAAPSVPPPSPAVVRSPASERPTPPTRPLATAPAREPFPEPREDQLRNAPGGAQVPPPVRSAIAAPSPPPASLPAAQPTAVPTPIPRRARGRTGTHRSGRGLTGAHAPTRLAQGSGIPTVAGNANLSRADIRLRTARAPDPVPDSPRQVLREGIVRKTWSPQAPTEYELREAEYNQGVMNYLFLEPQADLRKFVGQRVRVEGEEYRDSRWRTPVLKIQTIELAP